MPADLLLATVAALGAQPFDADQDACRFQHRDRQWVLKLHPGMETAYVSGRMSLEVVLPEHDPQKILLALYLNVGLREALPFPLWFGLDPEDDLLSLHFANGAETLDAERLAAMVEQVADLGARDDLLQPQEGAEPAP
ncbi:MAG TPA: CesT family type III secretion system chaperone [Burkholderiaceae bacterium]|nr:CesT family type III secretion system chaperone [Burkholderiaceae bacterium]